MVARRLLSRPKLRRRAAITDRTTTVILRKSWLGCAKRVFKTSTAFGSLPRRWCTAVLSLKKILIVTAGSASLTFTAAIPLFASLSVWVVRRKVIQTGGIGSNEQPILAQTGALKCGDCLSGKNSEPEVWASTSKGEIYVQV